MQGNGNQKERMDKLCPVCGMHKFEELNAFEQCPICGWYDDLVQRMDPDYRNGFNKKSLNEYRDWYKVGKIAGVVDDLY